MLQCYLGISLHYYLLSVIGIKSLNSSSIQDLKYFNFFYHFFSYVKGLFKINFAQDYKYLNIENIKILSI